MEVSFVGVAGTVVGKGLPRAVTDVRYSRRRLCSTSATLGDDSVSDRAKEALQIQTEYGAIEKADLAEEMSKSYMAYAMSVILGRALPDIRDGLKPVHRRILYAMHQMKVGADSPYRKSARVVGEVLGKYHPHGEGSVYDALVRMAQTFSSSIPLIDGHGNFGSIDGDSPAAMRYTECRLSKLSTQALLRDIEYGTVDFTPNFDSMEQEPNVIPSRIPNLLISGSQGIAVGVATKIPPFNLAETLEALGYLLDNPDCSSEELAEILPAPDFPTGGQIVGLSGARDLFMTGKGKIMMRAKTHFELVKLKGGRTREAIIVTEIPYQLNKSTIVKSIAELVNSKQLEGVADLRDESDRSGTRIVVEVAKSAHSEVVRNNLLKKSALQTSFSGQIVALDGGKLPKLYNVRECLEKFIEFRKQIILKRAKFEMDKAAARDHTVQGYLKVLRDVDNAIRIIRNSEEAKEAKAQLMSPAGSFGLSAEQADAVLNLPLRRITKMETSSLTVEHEKLEATIADLRETLVNDEKVCKIMKAEFAEVLKSAGKKAERRTEIVSGSPEYEDELKLIPNGRSVIVITEKGYMKRMPISNFNVQHRGGTGSSGIGNLREDDGVSHFFTCRDHDTVIVITKIGIVYRLPAYKIPVSPRSSRGTLISKLFPHMTSKVAEVLIVHESEEDEYLVIVTKRGRMKKITLSILAKISSTGSVVMALRRGDEVKTAKRSKETDNILLCSRKGLALRASLSNDMIRAQLGRRTEGVIGMRLQDDDEIIDVVVNKKDSEEDYVLCVLSSGIGKRFRCRDLTEQRRGGKGSIYAKLSRENENVVAVKPCEPDDQFMLITTTGAVVRVEASVVPFYKGRFARGVKLQKLKEDSEVIGVDLINKRIQEDTEDSVELVNPELASEELSFTGVGTESDDSEAVKDGDQS